MSMPVPYLTCPIEVHDEIKSSPHRIRTETIPIGVQPVGDGTVLYLRNHSCGGTLALETDVDAEAEVDLASPAATSTTKQ